MTRWKSAIVAALLASPTAAHAVNYTYSDVSNLTNTLVQALVKTVAVGADHRSYQPASSLGALVGLDVGIDAVGISVPTEFKEAMASAGASQDFPALLPLPRVNIHKGLPFGVDLGFSYIGLDSNKVVGADAKWTILPGGAVLPAVAVQGGMSLSRIFFMRTRTYTLDALVSKNLAYVFEPFVGAGMQFYSGDLAVPIGGPNGLSLTVSGHHSSSAMHVYAGLPIKLLVLKLTAIIDHSFAGVTTYGAKVSLSL